MSLPSADLATFRSQASRRSAPLSVIGASKRATLKELPFLREEPDEELDLRQLRHHTKNALQRILGLIAQAPGLHDTPEGERIALELEQRIQLSATISNALFGLTRAPGSMSDRLNTLGSSVIELLHDPAQLIGLEVSVRGQCPAALRETVLRVAHELIGNAVKHGMRGRRTGRIAIRLDSSHPGRTRLTVTDDGRGFAGMPGGGEGLSVARGLAEQLGGTLRLTCRGETVAVLELPHEGQQGLA
jgi:two-component sensor histidine kinase